MFKKKARILIGGVLLGISLFTTTASAYTREFLFHMYPGEMNGGYSATKDDNENYAYITPNSFYQNKSGQIISMWVSDTGSDNNATLPWSYTASNYNSTNPNVRPPKFHYTRTVYKNESFQLSCELFGGGYAEMGGRWTP